MYGETVEKGLWTSRLISSICLISKVLSLFGQHVIIGRLPRKGHAPILQSSRPVDHEPGGIHLSGHVCDHHLDRLMLFDGNPELPPLPGIANRLVKGGLGDPESLGGDAHTAGIESGEPNIQPLSLHPEKVFPRYPAVVQSDRANRVGPDPAKVFQISHHKPGGTPFRHDNADSPVPGFGIGAGKYQAPSDARRAACQLKTHPSVLQWPS